MYEMIYNALKEAGLENKYEPQDYLNFFCLGNREAPDGQTPSGVGASSTEKTPQVYYSSLNVSLSRFNFVSASYLCLFMVAENSGTH